MSIIRGSALQECVGSAISVCCGEISELSHLLMVSLVRPGNFPNRKYIEYGGVNICFLRICSSRGHTTQ